MANISTSESGRHPASSRRRRRFPVYQHRGVTLLALCARLPGHRHVARLAGLVVWSARRITTIRQFLPFDEETVDRRRPPGGTFFSILSRTNPGRVPKSHVPAHLERQFTAEKNDLHPEVLRILLARASTLSFPFGAANDLSYGVRIQKKGFRRSCYRHSRKTMVNGRAPGTRNYCNAAQATRGLRSTRDPFEMVKQDLRTSAASHERFIGTIAPKSFGR